MNSKTRMLAAVPIAHQPCGANGVQLSPPREGSATTTAAAITTTRTVARASWKPDDTRRPKAFAATTAPNMPRPTAAATGVPDPVRPGAGEPADQRDGGPAAQHRGDEPAAGDDGCRLAEPFAHVGADPAGDR